VIRSDAEARSTSPAPSPSTNLPTLRIFIASRRPTFICASSNGESAPGRAPGAPPPPPPGAPPAPRVRAVPPQDVDRRRRVALRLRHLLAVGVDHESGDRG